MGNSLTTNKPVEVLVFVDKRKTGEPKEKPSELDENQQQTQLTYLVPSRGNWRTQRKTFRAGQEPTTISTHI